MNRWLAALPLVALVALGLMFGVYSLNRDPKVVPQALVGQPLPALTLPSLDDGRPQVLTEVVRGPALVNVFASWCAPCEIEHPVLVEMKGQGVRIIGVTYKDAPDNSRAFLQRMGDPFAERLVDRDGHARHAILGLQHFHIRFAAGQQAGQAIPPDQLAIQWDVSTGDPAPNQSARAIADEIAAAAADGATGMKAMGRVVSAVRGKAGPTADGAAIAAKVKSALAG